MAIARHFFASSTLMAEAGWAIDRYAVRARTINVLKLFAYGAIGTTSFYSYFGEMSEALSRHPPVCAESPRNDLF